MGETRMSSPPRSRFRSRSRTRNREREQDRDQTRRRDGERNRYCPECESAQVTTSASGERVCPDCGLVVDETRIDRGPEWTAYSHAEKQEHSRVGAPITQTMHDRGLTTAIDWRDEDAAGRALSDRQREQMARLRQWQERIRTSGAGERTLQFALGEIDRMASALGVPQSVREVACVLYRRALTDDLIRGRSVEGVTAAALYAACRRGGLPRSLDEITEVSRIERKEIGRTYRYLARELGLDMEPVDPSRYVPRFRSALGLSEAVETTAAEVVDRAAAKGALSGKSPIGFAAGALYVASLLCDEDVTQEDVAAVAQVTSVTVRNHYQAQADALGLSAGNDLSNGTSALLRRDREDPTSD